MAQDSSQLIPVSPDQTQPMMSAQVQKTKKDLVEPKPQQPEMVETEPLQLLMTEPKQEPPQPVPTTEQEPPHSPPVPAMAESRSSLAAVMDREEKLESQTAAAGEEKPMKIPRSLGSFKEESNRVIDLSDLERKSLQELKRMVEEALTTNQLAEISIWGIPLLKDDRTDIVLLKFLRARDFKAREAFTMLKNTIQWRKEFKIDELLKEDLGDELNKIVFMHGNDREGHPVCYNVYGEFQNKELYQRTFSDEEKREKFLRWRIQVLEKSIRKLEFSPGGVCTIFQVNDLKNLPGVGKKELRIATRQAVQLLQDNYPEFVAKQVFINAPWWYLAFYTMISPFITQRSKSKLVFSGPSRSPETLFKYVSPEEVPVQYGGLSLDYCDPNGEFTIDDAAIEITLKPSTKQNVEIIIQEKCVIVWEVRVVGWEVSYGAEFLPENEGYTIVIQKPRKMGSTDEAVVCQRFKVKELGKVVVTIDNLTSKRKKLIYRYKVKPLV